MYQFLNSRLTIGARFGLIAICFTVPIVLLLFLYVSQVFKDVGFVQKELEGARYLEQVWPKFMAAALDPSARPTTGLDAVHNRAFDSASAAKAFIGAGRDAKLDAGITLILAIADGSNLTLDTDLDSYYAMNAATVALPKLVAASVAVAKATSAQNRALALRQTQIYADAAQSSLALAMQHDASGQARKTLTAPASALLAATTAVQGLTSDAPGGVANCQAACTTLQRTADAVWQADSTELDRMLQTRLDRLHNLLAINLSLVALATATAVLLMLLTTKGLARRLNALLGTMDRLIAKDATVEVPYQSDRNETGRIAATLAAFKQGLVEGAELLQVNQTQQALVFEERLRAEAAKASAREHQHWAEMAGEIAGVGRWRREPLAGMAVWSKEMYRICGCDPAQGVPGLAQAISFFHPDDQAIMTREMDAAGSTGEPFARDVRIVRPDGEIRHVISRGSAELGPDGQVQAVFGVIMDVTEVKHAEQVLRESEERYRLLAENVTDIITLLDIGSGITFISPACQQVMGYSPDELIGRRMLDLVHPEDARGVQAAVAAHIAAGPDAAPISTHYRLWRKDGQWLWIEGRPKVLFDADGRPVAIQDSVRDISERKAAEERQTLMVHELNHRVKNTLATVQSIAMQTQRSAENTAAFTEAFNSRLVALSHSHDLLTQNAWSGAWVRELLTEHLGPHQTPDGARFRLDGPDVRVSPKAAVALGMALGELATNATRHGALSIDAGSINVSWARLAENDAARLSLVWREQDGPPVSPPTRRGLGMRLIERGLAHELGGSVRLTFQPTGVVCEIEFPLTDVSQ